MALSLEFKKKHGFLASDDSEWVKTFTTVPTGKFNIDQYRKNRPDFWEVLTKSDEQLTKRAVVVSDWSFQYGAKSPDNQYLLDLLDEDTPLYFWIGRLVKINNKKELSQYINKIEPANPVAITNEAALIGVEANKLKIVDYFNNRNILTNTLSQGKVLDFADLLAIKEASALEKVLKELKAEKSLTLKLTDLELQKCNKDFFNFLLTSLPIEQLELTNINDKISLTQLSSYQLSKIKSIKVKDYIGTLSDINSALKQLPQLQSLQMTGQVKMDDVQLHKHNLKDFKLYNVAIKADRSPQAIKNFAEFLQQFDQLEKLSLTKTPSIENELNKVIVNGLPKLTAIELKDVLSPEYIIPLLAQHPDLEQCDLTHDHSAKFMSRYLLKPDDLLISPKLKSLRIEAMGCTLENIDELLIKFPALEKLTLKADVLPEGIKLGKAKLPNLKNLHLLGRPEGDDFASFLKNSPQLQSLSMESPTRTQLDALASLTFPNLTKFEFEYLNFTADKFFTFVQNQPSLKELKGGFGSIVQPYNSPIIPLLNLETCTFQNNSNTNLIKDAVRIAPNLKTITLDGETIKTTDEIATIEEKQIESAKLDGLDFANSLLATSIVQNPRLKFLEINTALNPEYLNKLRISPNLVSLKLKFSGSDIDYFPDTFNFLNSLHQLRNLDLKWESYAMRYEENQPKDFNEALGNNSFPSIENLSIELSLDKAPSLKDLLKHFPNVRTLTLNNNLLLSQLNTINVTEYPHMKTIILKSDQVDDEYLASLKIACPHISFVIEPKRIYYLDEHRRITESKIHQKATERKIPLHKNNGIIDTKNKRIDTKTADVQTRMTATQYFLPKEDGFPKVNHYRLKVHKAIDATKFTEYTCDTSPALGELRKKYDKQKSQPNIFYGGIKLESNEWTPLPSLTPRDRLLEIEAKIPLDIIYSQEVGLYFIRPRQTLTESIHLNFLVDATLQKPTLNYVDPKPTQEILDLIKSIRFANGVVTKESEKKIQFLKTLPVETQIAYLSEFCRSFTVGETQPGQSYEDSINNLIASGHGACRHRMHIFTELANALGIKAYGVANDVHAFVELEDKEPAVMIDLGGYPSDIVLNTEVENTLAATDDSVISIVQKKEPEKNQHSKVFNVWEKTKHIAAENYDEFCKKIMEDSVQLPTGKRNILVTFSTRQEMDAFNAAMARYNAQKNSENFMHRSKNIYIEKFQDINDKELMVNDNDKAKEITGHILSDVQKTNKGDAIIFNLSEYGTSAVSYCNALTEVPRRLINTKVPPSATVIGTRLADTRIGPDVFSRFEAVYKCPTSLSGDVYNKNIIALNNINYDVSHFPSIDCYDGSNWREQLCGKYHIAGENYHFEKGELVKIADLVEQEKLAELKKSFKASLQKAASQNAKGIILYNPPMNDPEFKAFLIEVTNSNYFHENGKDHELPENFKIIIAEKTYNLAPNKYQYSVNKFTPDTSWQYQLNNQNYNLFFTTYMAANGNMYEQTGFLPENSGKTINILVNEQLNTALWAKLLDKAKEHNCVLNFIFAPNMPIPEAMKSAQKETIASNPHKPIADLIISNDLDLSALKLKGNNIRIVSVDETHTYADLFDSVSVEKGKFTAQIACILQALQAGETIVLKGKISKPLAHAVQTLWADPPYLYVNGRKEYQDSIKGRLIIVTEEKHHFDVTPIRHDKFNQDALWQQLLLDGENSETVNNFRKIYNAFIARALEANITLHFSYAQIKAMLKQAEVQPQSNIFKSFLLMHPKAKQLLPLSEEFYPSKLAEAFKSGDEVIQKRLQDLDTTLAHSPYAFIVGPSGSGKSTLVLDELRKRQNTALFVGLENLETCLITKTDKKKILFVDEANLEKTGTLNIFEGLFDDPPSIILKGKLYPAKDIQIIFAGNYADYAKRQEQKILRHGGVIEFPALPDIFLQEKIMQPLLDKLDIRIKQPEIMAQLLAFYQYALELKVPFTPRNLTNMILRLNLLLQNVSGKLEDKLLACLWSAAYNEIENIPDLNAKENLKNFIQNKYDIHNLQKQLNDDISFSTESTFVLTESRKVPLRNLKQQLELRQFKVDHPELNLGGGGSGILFEGSAGIGKSKMVLEFLETLGYQNPLNVFYSPDKSNKIYYHIVPSMDMKTVEETFTKAFHEGAVVLVDEFTSFNLERILNRLMSGVDMQGNPAKKQGFFVIGTQNPISYVGRQALSIALENRFTKIYLPDYTYDELIKIGKARNIPDGIVTKLVQNYLISHKNAIDNFEELIPTFRDFERTLNIVSQNLKDKRCADLIPRIVTWQNPTRQDQYDRLMTFQRTAIDVIACDNSGLFDKQLYKLNQGFSDFVVTEKNLEKSLGIFSQKKQQPANSAIFNTKVSPIK